MKKEYCVYEHVFPNGKRYIGITCNTEKRWRNGKGYETQPKMAKAIECYGWENIEHNIIVDRIDKDQAERLEEYLIGELNTIAEGYNTAIGGTHVNGYYLDEYILKMLSYAKRRFPENYIEPFETENGEIGLPELIAKGKTDKGIADFFNEASEAVTMKHREYSTTSENEVLAYFFHMKEYCLLHMAIAQGIDVSNWKEETCYFETFRKDQYELQQETH